jgi:hypothetical protein
MKRAGWVLQEISDKSLDFLQNIEVSVKLPTDFSEGRNSVSSFFPSVWDNLNGYPEGPRTQARPLRSSPG